MIEPEREAPPQFYLSVSFQCPLLAKPSIMPV